MGGGAITSLWNQVSHWETKKHQGEGLPLLFPTGSPHPLPLTRQNYVAFKKCPLGPIHPSVPSICPDPSIFLSSTYISSVTPSASAVPLSNLFPLFSVSKNVPLPISEAAHTPSAEAGRLLFSPLSSVVGVRHEKHVGALGSSCKHTEPLSWAESFGVPVWAWVTHGSVVRTDSGADGLVPVWDPTLQ